MRPTFQRLHIKRLIKAGGGIAALGISFLTGWFLAFSVAPSKAELNNAKAELARIKTATLEEHDSGGNYKFISPLLMCDSLPIDFPKVRAAEKAADAVIKSARMRGDITMASVFFRDLNNGPWFGINEKERFIPASLLKVPLLMTYLQMAESRREILDTKIVYDGAVYPITQNYVYAEPLVKGKAYSVAELLRRMMITSDNNAMAILTDESLISLKTVLRVYKDLGVPAPEDASAGYEVDPVMYASFFRVLYTATYLSREMSEYALNLMSTSDFDDGLRAGVPKRIPISHKFGERVNLDTGERQLHDCGIVYIPGKPYLACIMTRGRSFDRLASVISDISREIYDNVLIEDLQPVAP